MEPKEMNEEFLPTARSAAIVMSKPAFAGRSGSLRPAGKVGEALEKQRG
jgi:hypothetical protein